MIRRHTHDVLYLFLWILASLLIFSGNGDMDQERAFRSLGWTRRSGEGVYFWVWGFA